MRAQITQVKSGPTPNGQLASGRPIMTWIVDLELETGQVAAGAKLKTFSAKNHWLVAPGCWADVSQDTNPSFPNTWLLTTPKTENGGINQQGSWDSSTGALTGAVGPRRPQAYSGQGSAPAQATGPASHLAGHAGDMGQMLGCCLNNAVSIAIKDAGTEGVNLDHLAEVYERVIALALDGRDVAHDMLDAKAKAKQPVQTAQAVAQPGMPAQSLGQRLRALLIERGYGPDLAKAKWTDKGLEGAHKQHGGDDEAFLQAAESALRPPDDDNIPF